MLCGSGSGGPNYQQFVASFAQPLNEEESVPQSQSTDGMSYLAVDEAPWEEQTPLSRRKILRLEEDIYIAIVQWDPGFTLPTMDVHGGEETLYVLAGTFVDQFRTSGPGTAIRGTPGSSHQPSTPDGVTFLVTRTLLPGERERIAPRSSPLF
ncbi:MAG: hypothetical protein ABS81_16420 [Pseudonocardia sp. SCN 72-86]|nr:MAG: hypothetical protein ABS81_16420 [Pseudonocardia sp. SCN 72-86]